MDQKINDLILFSAQILIIFVVIIVSLVNLTLGHSNQNLWIVMLSCCLGYIMPNPKIDIFKNVIKEHNPDA